MYSRELVGLDHGFRRLRQRLQANGATMAAVNSLASQFQSARQVAQSATRWFHPVGVTGL